MTKIRRSKRTAWLRRALALTLTCMVLAGGMALGASASTSSRPVGAVDTEVYLNGAEILEGECFIYRSVTYVPLRSFADSMDECRITWNGTTATATVKSDDLTLTVQDGALYIIANGRYLYTVEEVLNLSGRLYVPIRPLAAAFAEEVEWNASARRVELTPRGVVRAISPAAYKADDVYWLARIISSEAKGEPFAGQIAVGNVVLNRVRHPSYPNTVYGVIFDRKHGTQFSPVSFGTIYQTPTPSAVAAAKICLEGYTLSDEVLFFLNPRIATNFWIVNNRTFAFRIGNHDFYK